MLFLGCSKKISYLNILFRYSGNRDCAKSNDFLLFLLFYWVLHRYQYFPFVLGWEEDDDVHFDPDEFIEDRFSRLDDIERYADNEMDEFASNEYDDDEESGSCSDRYSGSG